MDGLFDRDVFLKLCCCDLWDEANEALGLTTPYRLEATSGERSNRRVLMRMVGEAEFDGAFQRTQDVIAKVPVLTDEMVNGILTSRAYQELAEIEDIDGGEHLLAAILMNLPDDRILLSGDKRFVKAFREHLPERWLQHSHAIISFERCLVAIEERFGFDLLLDRVRGVTECDTSLRLAIGIEPTREAFRQAMNSFDPCSDD